MFNKEKFRKSFKFIGLALGLAFIGPVVFLLGYKSNISNELQILLKTSGWLTMLAAIFCGISGIQKIISSFFDNSSE